MVSGWTCSGVHDTALPLPFPEGISWQRGSHVCHIVLEYWCPSQSTVPATSLTHAESDMGLLLPVRGVEEQAVPPAPAK